ncbi:MAG: hypothetical protein CMD31_07410 [Flavobacteriales bacterium]|nr:hypothetical protein [Flavobacteriales bacterium]|tara:strand:+ start:18778 stop:19776 length:999 start_codon:yes stop_codon:yes gene_type:complete
MEITIDEIKKNVTTTLIDIDQFKLKIISKFLGYQYFDDFIQDFFLFQKDPILICETPIIFFNEKISTRILDLNKNELRWFRKFKMNYCYNNIDLLVRLEFILHDYIIKKYKIVPKEELEIINNKINKLRYLHLRSEDASVKFMINYYDDRRNELFPNVFFELEEPVLSPIENITYNKETTHSCKITLKSYQFKFLKFQKELDYLAENLLSNHYINNKEDFSNLFICAISNKKREFLEGKLKVEWCDDNQYSLAYLFNLLIQKKIVAMDGNIYKNISETFLFKKRTISSDSLRSDYKINTFPILKNNSFKPLQNKSRSDSLLEIWEIVNNINI